MELTRATRDGGVDIYAHLMHDIGNFLVLVECKKWLPRRGVGVEIVQRLYGVQQAHRANMAMIVTTSYFTKPARTEAASYPSQMKLSDYDVLKTWLWKYKA